VLGHGKRLLQIFASAALFAKNGFGNAFQMALKGIASYRPARNGSRSDRPTQN
jgi:hypothetical protein